MSGGWGQTLFSGAHGQDKGQRAQTEAQEVPSVLVWLRPATKAPRGWHTPAGVRRRMERNRQKLVGLDKCSLTEQQTKGTGTTTIQIRRKHNTNRTTHRAVLSQTGPAPLLLSHERVPGNPLPPTRSQHDGTWYGIPCSVWSGWVSPPSCAPSWIPVKINPVLAKPRTLSTPYSVPSTSCPCPPLSSWSPPLLLSPDIIPLVYGSSL